jgi:hypothetical protein
LGIRDGRRAGDSGRPSTEEGERGRRPRGNGDVERERERTLTRSTPPEERSEEI